MGEQRSTTTAVGTGAGALPALAATGIAALAGLVPLMIAVGTWWLMAVTLATLLATLGLVVLVVMRALEQTGDSVATTPAAVPALTSAPRAAGALVLRTA